MRGLILVTGVTGTVGQEVVKSLVKKNIKIRVGVRNLKKIESMPWFSRVESVILDYEKPETLKNALVGVSKLFLVTPPGTYREEEVSRSILLQGEEQRLKHIVRLSGMGADKHNLFGNHHAADMLLLSSNIDYTALQPNTYMQNFYNYSTSIKEKQKIIEPAANGKMSFIDARDIAEVATTVLIEAGHINTIYELTGGESLSYYQVAKQFSELLGKEIIYQPLSAQEYISIKEAEGMPAEFVERFVQFFQMVKNGEYAHVSSTVEKILCRPPITLKQFITDYRDRFVF
jgi:uncharacterized protein YbjT (DUF2867 family)